MIMIIMVSSSSGSSITITITISISNSSSSSSSLIVSKALAAARCMAVPPALQEAVYNTNSKHNKTVVITVIV